VCPAPIGGGDIGCLDIGGSVSRFWLLRLNK